MTGVVDGELPVDGSLFAVAAVAPGGRFFAQELNRCEAAMGKALPGKWSSLKDVFWSEKTDLDVISGVVRIAGNGVLASRNLAI